MKKKDIEKFTKALTAKIKSELDYYNFEFTSACETWLNSLVDYFISIGDYKNSKDIKEFTTNIIDNTEEMAEDYDLDWPNVSESAAIVGQALKDDSSHFMYITEALGYSMSPDDCFKAEWFWEGSIRPTIIEFITEYEEQ